MRSLLPMPSLTLACFLVALALAGAASPAHAQLAFELVSKAEVERDRAARPKDDAPTALPELRTRSLTAPGGQVFTIRVVAPSGGGSVSAPLRIELAFLPLPGTRIVPSTFRVLYGVLKLDLTERLKRFATITEAGVVVDNAVVPDGMHRMFVQVADDKGNVAEQELRFRVGGGS